MIRAGARGYVTKTISGRELADAVRRVRAGDPVFSPRLAGFVLDAFSDRPGAAPPTDPGAGSAHAPRTRRPAAARPRLRLQRDRGRAVHLGQDRRDARVERAAQDAAVEPVRALALGVGPPAGLSGPCALRSRPRHRPSRAPALSFRASAAEMRRGAGVSASRACCPPACRPTSPDRRSAAVRYAARPTVRGRRAGRRCAAAPSAAPPPPLSAVRSSLASPARRRLARKGPRRQGRVHRRRLRGIGRLQRDDRRQHPRCVGRRRLRGSWSPGAQRSAAAGSEGPPAGSRPGPRRGGRSPQDQPAEPELRCRWRPGRQMWCRPPRPAPWTRRSRSLPARTSPGRPGGRRRRRRPGRRPDRSTPPGSEGSNGSARSRTDPAALSAGATAGPRARPPRPGLDRGRVRGVPRAATGRTPGASPASGRSPSRQVRPLSPPGSTEPIGAAQLGRGVDSPPRNQDAACGPSDPAQDGRGGVRHAAQDRGPSSASPRPPRECRRRRPGLPAPQHRPGRGPEPATAGTVRPAPAAARAPGPAAAPVDDPNGV